jgi:hypothetical protein
LETAAMSADSAPDAGMGGIGISVRPRLSPHFALDIGLDFLGGKDFYGEERSESAFLFTPMFFVNPRSRIQLYFLAGVGFSGATVIHADATRSTYHHAGIDGGAGLEFRFWRHVAIDTDVLAFVRGRTDANAELHPEFYDPETGRSTNTSGGALFRLGMTYYW